MKDQNQGGNKSIMNQTENKSAHAPGLDSRQRLCCSTSIPLLGLGVWKAHEETEAAVLAALEAGYRHIDTAACYGNEKEVGEAIAKSGIPREELFITTKIWNDDIRAGRTIEAARESLERLGLDYVDLLLLHWPVEGYEKAWKDLEQLKKEGIAKSIGVSNFRKSHLEHLMAQAEKIPAVDQIEWNPGIQDDETIDFCRDNKIIVEAWSPLGHGTCLSDPVIAGIAEKYGKTPAQIILRWLLQQGAVILPKSVHEERIRQNADLYDFVLSPEDMEKMKSLNAMRRTGPDPDHFNF